MSDPGSTLERQVRDILSHHLQSTHSGRHRIDAPHELQAAVERFRSRYGGLRPGNIPQDRLQPAIVALRRRGVAALTPGSRFILACCLARPLPQLNGESILMQESLAEPLLECWEAEFRKGTLSPMHWRGLIHSYLQSPPMPGVNRLRLLLLSSMAAIVVKHRIKPLWLEVVERHGSLLGRHPCDPYVQELLEGRRERLDDLKSAVSLPERSWFWESMSRALVEEIGRASDARFRQVRPLVLAYANEEPATRSGVRAAVMARHSKLQAKYLPPKPT